MSATNILIVANLLIFCVVLMDHVRSTPWDILRNTRVTADFPANELLVWGGNYGPKTLGGQYWRVVTSVFLHSSIVHLAWNMLFLWRLGRQLDLILGWAKTLAIYLFSSVGCILTSIAWLPTRISVGSSGGIAGLAGALVSLLIFAKLDLSQRNRRSILLWAVLLTPISIASGLRSPGFEVDNAGHLGGFMSGLLIGALLAWACRVPAIESNVRQRRALGLAAVAFTLLFVALIRVRSDVIDLYQGEQALEHNDPAAITHIQKYVTRNPKDAIGHELLGTAYEQLSRDREATAEYQRVLELEPNNPQAKYDLARTYILTRPQEAIPLFRESLPYLPEGSDKYFNFASALQLAGKLQEAEQAAQRAVALNPKSARNHDLLSVVLFRLGKTEQGIAESKLAEQLRSR